MKKIKKVTVTMSERQAQLIVDALDLFKRLPMGQIGEIEFFFRQYMSKRIAKDDLDMIKPLLEMIKRILFRELQPGAYFSIIGDKAPEFAKEIYDLMQSIRNPMCRVRT